MQRDVHPIALSLVCLHEQGPSDNLACHNKHWLLKHAPKLVPVCSRLSRCSGQDYLGASTQELDIKPPSDAVHVGCECRCEFERDLYPLQLSIAGAAKV